MTTDKNKRTELVVPENHPQKKLLKSIRHKIKAIDKLQTDYAAQIAEPTKKPKG